MSQRLLRPRRVPTGAPAPPAPCRLGNAAELAELRPGGLREALAAAAYREGHPRKLWEWEFIAQSARDLGLLDGSREALGIAVGTEPLIFFFARHTRAVTATDLYSGASAWSTARVEDSGAILDLSPFSYPRERVEIRNADMRSLPFPDGHFDFCWSCSSIEHVDNLAQLVGVYNEIARVLKPGGHAILTTEFALTPPYPLPGVIALDPALLARVVEAHPSFELIGPVDLGYDPLHIGNVPEPRLYAARPAVGAGISTDYFSVGRMAQMCGLSTIVPIGFVLMKRRNARPADWRQFDIGRPLRSLTEALLALERGAASEAAGHLYSQIGASTRQFQMIAHRYLLDAALRIPAPPELIGAAEDNFLAALPAGDLQDADNIQLLAFSLGEHGRHAEAAEIYRKAAASPSTYTTHAVHLACRSLMQAQRAGMPWDALDFLTALVSGMLRHGIPWSGIGPLIDREIGGEPGLAAAVAEALAAARAGALDDWRGVYEA